MTGKHDLNPVGHTAEVETARETHEHAPRSRKRRRSSYVRFSWDFMTHPRCLELTDAQFRCWFALLASLVGIQVEDGEFELAQVPPHYTARGRRRLTAKDVEHFVDLGLVDRVDDEFGRFRVKNWPEWSPADATQAYRLRRWRERQASEQVGTSIERLRALAGDAPSWESSS